MAEDPLTNGLPVVVKIWGLGAGEQGSFWRQVRIHLSAEPTHPPSSLPWPCVVGGLGSAREAITLEACSYHCWTWCAVLCSHSSRTSRLYVCLGSGRTRRSRAEGRSPTDKRVAVIKAKGVPDFAEHKCLRHAVAHGCVVCPVNNAKESSLALSPTWADGFQLARPEPLTHHPPHPTNRTLHLPQTQHPFCIDL